MTAFERTNLRSSFPSHKRYIGISFFKLPVKRYSSSGENASAVTHIDLGKHLAMGVADGQLEHNSPSTRAAERRVTLMRAWISPTLRSCRNIPRVFSATLFFIPHYGLPFHHSRSPTQ
jgi:hypothetical protein